tara:strand:+ start:678 stop:947 length:270 start_codon:yes stop_codon:yes gene_type:complete
MSFWEKVNETLPKKKEGQEVKINLAEKLLKLDLDDISFLYDLIMKTEFKGDEIEGATAVLLKVRFIMANLQGQANAEKIQDHKADNRGD